MNIYFGENLKNLRREKNLTQEKLADFLGVSFQTVSKWERGDTYPDITMLPEIAGFFKISVDDLLGVNRAENEKEITEKLQEYDNLTNRFQAGGGYDMDVEVDKISNGLGITAAQREQLFDSLSGGEKTRVNLARLLLEKTDILLLDEPTNGLDIPSKSDFRRIMARHTTPESIVIISTHQVKDVENLIDPIVILTKDDVLINASIEEIAAKLYFSFDSEKNDQAIYSEMVPGGFINVMRNTDALESNVLIEPLFNTAVRNRQIIKEIFK